jgi:tyrosinase
MPFLMTRIARLYSTFVAVDGNVPALNALNPVLTSKLFRPQHMLIPKGTTQGLPAELFVMISNYEEDRVQQDLAGVCNDAAAFCGIRDRQYPDRKPMGFPFDRNGRQGADTVSKFLTPNMRVQDISIVFTDRTVQRQ